HETSLIFSSEASYCSLHAFTRPSFQSPFISVLLSFSMAVLSTNDGRFKMLETRVREIFSRDPAVQAIKYLFETIAKVNEQGLHTGLIQDLDKLQDSVDMCRIYDSKNHSPIRSAVYAMVEGTKCLLATLNKRHSIEKNIPTVEYEEGQAEHSSDMKEEELEIEVKEEEEDVPVKEEEPIWTATTSEMNPKIENSYSTEEVKQEPIDPEDPEMDPLPGPSNGTVALDPKEEEEEISNMPLFVEDPLDMKDEELDDFPPLAESWLGRSAPSSSKVDHTGYSAREAANAPSISTLMTTHNGFPSTVDSRSVPSTRNNPRSVSANKHPGPPFPCPRPQCRKAFSTQAFLDNHMKEHPVPRPDPYLGVARHNCRKCSKAFSTALFLRQHMKEEHVCPKGCGAMLKSRPLVKRHLKNQHGL
ncbi:hypothetical protein PMAYCL1PPCAC_18977, partial [Pristionchus mayeri]